MRKSPLSRSLLAGAWEDATREWDKRVEVETDSETTVKSRPVPISELELEGTEGGGRHALTSAPALAVLLHPSAPPTRSKGPTIVSPLPRHRGSNNTTSLAKTLATKALANAHRRSNRIDAMNSNPSHHHRDGGVDPSYVVVDPQQHTSTPYAETVAESPSQSRGRGAVPVDVVMQDGSLPWAESPVHNQSMPARMPEPNIPPKSPGQRAVPPPQMTMPEPTIPSTVQQQAPLAMPEPQLKMPEPHLEQSRRPPIVAPASMPLPSLPQAVTPMTMPDTSVPVLSPPPTAMPVPEVPSTAFPGRTPDPTTYTNTQPLAPRAALIPESTYDPASLPAPQWTDTRTPAVTTLAEDDETLLARMKSALEHLPQSMRASLPKEELVRMVLEAVDNDRLRDGTAHDQPQEHLPDASWLPYHASYPYAYPYAYPASFRGQEIYEAQTQQPWPASEYAAMQESPPVSANDWFQMNGGGVLPAGWTAHYEYRVGQWYYSNQNISPPTTTWQDPRLPLPAAAPLPMPAPPPLPSMPINSVPPLVATRQDVDYLASQFGALQALRQYEQNASGPVSAEMHFERKQAKEIAEATRDLQRAQQDANEAAAKSRPDDFQAAQEDMVKGRGRLDRIAYEARLRSAATAAPALLPNALQHYQGVTRGFEMDPSFVRPRTMYTDARVVPPPPPPPGPYPYHDAAGTTTTSFSGRVMGKFLKQRLPNSMMMPTAWPIPPGMKYKASTTTPTPYSIPEFCFAWDMLLRNRRAPNIPAPYPY